MPPASPQDALRGPIVRFGQSTPAETEKATEQGFKAAFRQLTPTFFVVAVATGAAFALGSALTSYFIRRFSR